MKKLIEGLKHFQEHVLWERQELFERSVHGQRPTAMLITCSDSRVLPETLMQADPGDLFVSRNAGNLVPPPHAPSGEAATIEYAISALRVTDIIICGHYRCGAVRAILHPEEGGELPKTREWLACASETKAAIEKEHPDLQGEALWDKAVERNVLAQINNLTEHPVVADALAAGTVRLHAWVLRFETSEVLAFDPMSNAFTPLLDMPVVHALLPDTIHPSAEPAIIAFPQPAQASVAPAWFDAIKSDIPASLVVFAVALPLCVAIAKASGVPTAAGIITAVIGGVVVGLLGGGPLQVSGPTAGLIIVLLGVQEKLGFASLGLIVFLAGLIQFAAGLLRLGQWFRAVSPAVILGMLAGIGAVLLAQQFHVTVDDLPVRSPLANYLGMPRALVDIFDGHPGHEGHLPAALIGLLTLSVLLLWKKVVPKRLHAIPSVLAAIVIATAAATLLNLPIQRVEFDSLASGFKLIDLNSLPALLGNSTVWQMAFTVAVLASAESLLTASAVDGMHTGPRTRYDRELAAQGLGNALCGVIGALPMAGVIVRTSANLEAGAKTRWASVFHGVWMLAIVLLMPGLLRLIPIAALAATLVLTGFRLIQFPAIRALWKESRSEGLICIAVAVTVVAVDLLTGVMLGVGLSVANLVYTFSRLRIQHRGNEATGQVTLVLEGAATFLRLPQLASALESISPGTILHVDFKGLSYIDHTCLTLLMKWEKQHEATGGELILNWDTLRARFHTARPRPQRIREVRADIASECGGCRERRRAA
ncbi:MAG: SulP family inorganic anion transporter [Pirellulales bacterium]